MPGDRVSFGLAGLSGQSVTDDRESYAHEIGMFARLAAEAEAGSFDSVWVTEHHVARDGYLPAPLIALAALAAGTERVRLGTNVALAPLYAPIRLAEEVAVVDQLSRGRVILGLGLGYRPEELAAFGVGAQERVGRLRDCLTLLRTAWRGDDVVVVGQDGRRFEVPVRPLPWQVDGPPIWLGSWVETGVRRARRLGDGYIAPVATLKDLSRRLAWLHDEEPLDGFPVAISLNGFVGGDDAWARAQRGADHVMSTYRDWYGASEDPAETGKGRLAGAVVGPPPHFVVGTPEECATAIAPLVRVLADTPGVQGHLLVRLTWPGLTAADALESVRLFGTEVIPAVRAQLAITT